MKKRRLFQIGCGLALTTILFCLTITPVRSAQARALSAQRSRATTSMNAIFYLQSSSLQPIFQSNIDNDVPNAVNSALTGVVNQLPVQDRGWATQMARALIQPSATLTGLTPQQNGILTTVQLSLYPGDPQPTNSQMLVTFNVQDSSTIQVSAQAVSGSPALMTGPIATFQMPVGQLSSIATTPTCGNAALAVQLQFPLSIGSGQPGGTSTSTGQMTQNNAPMRQAYVQQTSTSSAPDSYIEIPASSLVTLGDSIGSLQINSSLTAQNIQIAVQGSDLIITSDIMLGSFQLATATTTVAPTTANGSLAVKVLKTTLTVFQIFTFPDNSYNQQIEQTLNSDLNGALTGKFTVTDATIGPTSALPCAASDSLVLTGTTNLIA